MFARQGRACAEQARPLSHADNVTAHVNSTMSNMAKRTTVTLIDDLDGSEAAESVQFSYRGVDYSIDLNEKHASAFDKAVAKYVNSATRESGRKNQTRPGTRRAADGDRRTDLSDIRAWAAANGYEVSDRGRVAAHIVEAYDAAQ